MLVRTDEEIITEAFKGNRAAVHLVFMLRDIANMWDDLVDRDKEVSAEDVNRVMWAALVAIPMNPFYRQHIDVLQPAIQSFILSWHMSNDLSHADYESRVISHVERYSICNVMNLVAMLIAGPDHARDWAPTLRRMGQRDTLAQYLHELEARDA
jgi:hypothetical protein